MTTYTVYFTDETCVGNEVQKMDVSAPNLETAYEFVNREMPDISIDSIRPSNDRFPF